MEKRLKRLALQLIHTSRHSVIEKLSEIRGSTQVKSHICYAVKHICGLDPQTDKSGPRMVMQDFVCASRPDC